LQSEAAIAARAAYAAAVERLRGGVIDIVSLSTNEISLFQNEDTLQQARIQRFQSAVALFQALGGGWPDR
jgi:outer membrane protein, multidrug efflux system